jgi:hypothetical protein
MPPEQDIFVDRKFPALAPSEDCESVMVHSLKWKTQPSGTRIRWLTIGEQHQWIANLHQDHPA